MTHYQQIIQIFVRYTPKIADPLSQRLNLPHKFSKQELSAFARLVEWAGRQDRRLASCIAEGGLALLDAPDYYRIYALKVKSYAQHGTIQGMAMARCLYHLLLDYPKPIQHLFLETMEFMRRTGPHTLTAPFDLLCQFLEESDHASVNQYLELLHTVFVQIPSFQDSQNLSTTIPDCCGEMHKDRRIYQMNQMTRILQIYPQWADPFAKGMKQGLNILSESALNKFVNETISRYEKNPARGASFLALSSEIAQDQYNELQSVVALSQISQSLMHYVQARTGISVKVRPISDIQDDHILPLSVCTDGQTIYVPDEMGIFANKRDNIRIYKSLIRFEAGLCEYQTFDFDLEKVLKKIKKPELAKNQDLITPDADYFFSLFKHPSLAEDLFNIIEQGRIRKCLSNRYPGMIRHALPLMQRETSRMIKKMTVTSPMLYLYARIALNMTDKQCRVIYSDLSSLIDSIIKGLSHDMSVDDSAAIVYQYFPEVYQFYKKEKMDYSKLNPPFGRKINIKLFYQTCQSIDIRAKIIRQKLNDLNIPIYQSDIRNRLVNKNGIISIRDIRRMYKQRTGKQLEINDIQLQNLFEDSDRATSENTSISDAPAYTYKEWDCHICDYIPAHTRVYCKPIDAASKGTYFYQLTLKRYSGLLKRIRRSFELLRPQSMIFLRQWREGDDFDYRALIEYAVDRRIRQTPSDRLYIKHIKQQRDVSVFLLIDLSRSTGFRIPQTHQRILEVEKEAIVLFCEALQESGDRFAIAAFSGLGRQCVEFFQVKSFDSPHSLEIKRRISALSPCRSTRMGAAIRHALNQLLQTASKTRLLIVLSDGLPNDLNYKDEYAINDTRMAIREARAVNIHVHGITVNIQQTEALDTLYGKGRHTLIQDVRELPDKLPVIYRRLTE